MQRRNKEDRPRSFDPLDSVRWRSRESDTTLRLRHLRRKNPRRDAAYSGTVQRYVEIILCHANCAAGICTHANRKTLLYAVDLQQSPAIRSFNSCRAKRMCATTSLLSCESRRASATKTRCWSAHRRSFRKQVNHSASFARHPLAPPLGTRGQVGFTALSFAGPTATAPLPRFFLMIR